VKGFKKCCISSAVDGTNGMLWNDHEENVGVTTECDKDEGTDCEEGNKWHWWVKVDRIWHSLCIKCMKLTVKYSFSRLLFLRDHLRFG